MLVLQYESNARFVKWSDGSMQLLLGSEVLDLSVQNATQDQSHLFLRHPKVSEHCATLLLCSLFGCCFLPPCSYTVFGNVFGFRSYVTLLIPFVVGKMTSYIIIIIIARVPECRAFYNLKAKF